MHEDSRNQDNQSSYLYGIGQGNPSWFPLFFLLIFSISKDEKCFSWEIFPARLNLYIHATKADPLFEMLIDLK